MFSIELKVHYNLTLMTTGTERHDFLAEFKVAAEQVIESQVLCWQPGQEWGRQVRRRWKRQLSWVGLSVNADMLSSLYIPAKLVSIQVLLFTLARTCHISPHAKSMSSRRMMPFNSILIKTALILTHEVIPEESLLNFLLLLQNRICIEKDVKIWTEILSCWYW